MAKRFIDTNLYKKPWIRELKPSFRSFWIYLLLDCNHAGIWNVDWEIASIYVGSKLSKGDMPDTLMSRLLFFDRDSKVFIPDFIDFQYGYLNPAAPVHKNIIKELKKYRLYDDVTGIIDVMSDDPNITVYSEDNVESEEVDEDDEDDIVFDPKQKVSIESEIIDYLNSKSKKNFRPLKSNTRWIKARLNEKYTMENFVTVINKKCKEWMGNSDMEKYIRPETLFGNRFDQYLNQEDKVAPQKPKFVSLNPQWGTIIEWFNSGLLNDPEKIKNMRTNGTINDDEKKHLLTLLGEIQ